MTTTAKANHSPATERKQKAQATLAQLQTEREQIVARQRTAQNTIEQLNADIVQAQRSGDPDRLRELRDNRREAEEFLQDLPRLLPTLNREIQEAEGELIMAERACCAEAWNRAQAEQVQLLKTIEDAIHMIADALDEKERLAVRQQPLIATVCPGSNHNAVSLKPELVHVITAHLQGTRTLSFRTVDWSSWPMGPHGNLIS